MPFPIIADRSGEIARKYGMIASNISNTETVRNVYIIDEKGIIRVILVYPLNVGRWIPEILRTVEALQMAEQYDGTVLDIPDFTEPEHEEGTILALNDPYGTASTSGYLQAKSFFSPNNGRYYLVINQGAYIPIYDLEKSNEPSFRIYDFSVGDHVEAMDVGFSADGRLAAVAGANGQVAVYELETGSMVCSFTDTYLARSLSEVRFNTGGSYLMVADFNLSSFRIYSVTNGQTLYVMHAVKEVDSWGFDEQTGDAVVKYTDGSALIARMFEDEETLLSYARENVK